MKKFAVILCGCGHLDGSEIYETVMTLLAIDRQGCQYTLFAPNEEQYHVMNHLTRQPTEEKRNMLVEAARIARGAILDLKDYHAENFDGLILPGGFGLAKNLMSYAVDGIHTKVMPDIEKTIQDTFTLHKPIGGLCIAPVLLAKVLGDITLTVGDDVNTIKDVETFGAHHINTKEGEVIADKKNMIFTTPCFMLNASVSDIADSANHLIETILENLV
ncbi:MAG: isoprenoid biosynthesis glyoxalase ElbB [Bacteroidales bacterium]|jgi:enhancing lycopene biosynthesis protein 2|nr:isoprenoid biosynthesis glyoxalase ElbB [Bacteroidales bacterium]